MMSTTRRVLAYTKQGPRIFTPKQRRRMIKKASHWAKSTNVLILADRHGEHAGIDAILMSTRPSARQDLINDILTRNQEQAS